jgi:hypothetical protein
MGLAVDTAYFTFDFCFNKGTSTGNGGYNFGFGIIAFLVKVSNFAAGFLLGGEGVGSRNCISIIFDFPQCWRPLF